MASIKTRTFSTNLKCPECGKYVIIRRKIGRRKTNGHVKHMYCPYCQKIVPFVEDTKSVVNALGEELVDENEKNYVETLEDLEDEYLEQLEKNQKIVL